MPRQLRAAIYGLGVLAAAYTATVRLWFPAVVMLTMSIAGILLEVSSASGVVADKKQYSFVAKASPWAIEWSYTCAPTTNLYALCDLIVAVYGADGKLVDEITPSPSVKTASESHIENLGGGTFYLWVSSTGTSEWKVAATQR